MKFEKVRSLGLMAEEAGDDDSGDVRCEGTAQAARTHHTTRYEEAFSDTEKRRSEDEEGRK
ncbi:hypothetical protein SAY87_027079 [Trapa incisa]|uniref:Uncharacterized protein n=1 Tax=Trapa incisa TaxID=236973 RepID=A0AAN7GMT9_9MYRT|nr:hypothetical protein SAY87_027079 [Trapa incisa]